MARRMGTKLLPCGVRAYSTRGGTSAEVGAREKAVVDELSELLGKRGLGYVPNAVSDPPGQREQILAALDAVISDFGEERLRRYRVNLRHLWEVREKVPAWVICEKGRWKMPG